ncbi:MAG: hypothetical protein P0111_13100 [Nitrospira sp.]|nr:hypothetical protein [Nitrospira sp.]
MSHSVVIAGSGYTGRYLAEALTKASRQFFATSRDPDRNLPHLRSEQRLRFDLLQPETWQNIPQRADLVWCFPAAPLEAVKTCAEAVKASSRRLVVLGSTSAYDVMESQQYPPPWLDETAAIDRTKPRVQGEEYLRQAGGAILLRIAGIYGPGRDPLEWIKNGRVGPSRRYVNLIHVEDLAGIVLAALERGRSGETYNVSDGTPRTWVEIGRTVEDRWKVRAPTSMQNHGPGKRIDTRKLIQELQPQLFHSNLYEALAALPRS